MLEVIFKTPNGWYIEKPILVHGEVNKIGRAEVRREPIAARLPLALWSLVIEHSSDTMGRILSKAFGVALLRCSEFLV